MGATRPSDSFPARPVVFCGHIGWPPRRADAIYLLSTLTKRSLAVSWFAREDEGGVRTARLPRPGLMTIPSVCESVYKQMLNRSRYDSVGPGLRGHHWHSVVVRWCGRVDVRTAVTEALIGLAATWQDITRSRVNETSTLHVNIFLASSVPCFCTGV